MDSKPGHQNESLSQWSQCTLSASTHLDWYCAAEKKFILGGESIIERERNNWKKDLKERKSKKDRVI